MENLNLSNIVLSNKREELFSVAKECFDFITDLSGAVRKDDKDRTGIQIFVRQPGTRNFVFFSVEEPSEAAQIFAIEKAIRSYTLGDFSSGNSAVWEMMEFPGSVMIMDLKKDLLQASVSGLKAEEDVAVAVMLLSSLSGLTPFEVCENVNSNKGELPECFYETNHYLRKFLGIK